jgi:hypothetical protein
VVLHQGEAHQVQAQVGYDGGRDEEGQPGDPRMTP